jgi:hypothetical protein
MKNFLLTYFLLISGLSCFSQNIEFFKEDLKFSLQDSLFVVDGLYYFRNTTDAEVKQMLFYPFPDVEVYGEIAFIEITKAGDSVSQLATETAKGSLFKVQIPAKGEVPFRIRYGQKLRSEKAKYIITTTQKWGTPFEQADYRLEVSSSVVVTNFSIPPDTLFQKDRLQIFTWKRTDFMPVVDFDFEFR